MKASPRFSQGFAEIVLMVADVNRAAKFYSEVVGLVPHREANAEWAWFWAGEPGVTQRLALHRGKLLFEEYSPLPSARRFGQIHFAFSVRRAQLEEAVAKVQSAGIAVYGPVRFEWMDAVSYYFYDPDGNLLEWWSPDFDARK
jgi:catechol 2,3-dioxygenase-like lactoylglutathione lyase family enzyme